MALVLVKNFPDRMYADRARQTLRQEGIESVIQSPDPGIFGAGSMVSTPRGVDLYVEGEDAEEAKALLNDVFDGI
ncbi:MAG TPA: DUF2007 domain-containing protein [Bacteroidota bacterium]|nr:DUF2007 domain-containing protein [Bacteroidota bacterium]